MPVDVFSIPPKKLNSQPFRDEKLAIYIAPHELPMVPS